MYLPSSYFVAMLPQGTKVCLATVGVAVIFCQSQIAHVDAPLGRTIIKPFVKIRLSFV